MRGQRRPSRGLPRSAARAHARRDHDREVRGGRARGRRRRREPRVLVVGRDARCEALAGARRAPLPRRDQARRTRHVEGGLRSPRMVRAARHRDAAARLVHGRDARVGARDRRHAGAVRAVGPVRPLVKAGASRAPRGGPDARCASRRRCVLRGSRIARVEDMRQQRSRLAWVALVGVVMAACGGSRSAATEPTHPVAPADAMRDRCPMAVPGTTVSAIDTADGIAIAFATTGDVAELRVRATAMAGMHDRMGAESTVGSGDMANMKPKMIPSTARETDADGGARIVITAKDIADLEALREDVRGHVAKMATGTCPMMGEGG